MNDNTAFAAGYNNILSQVEDGGIRIWAKDDSLDALDTLCASSSTSSTTKSQADRQTQIDYHYGRLQAIKDHQ